LYNNNGCVIEKVKRLWIQKSRHEDREGIPKEIWHVSIITMYGMLLEWSLLV
jgi:hypothetical protein